MSPTLEVILLCAHQILIRVRTVIHPAVILVCIDLTITEIVRQTAINWADIRTEHGLCFVFHLGEVLLVNIFLLRGCDRCLRVASVNIDINIDIDIDIYIDILPIIIIVILTIYFLQAY